MVLDADRLDDHTVLSFNRARKVARATGWIEREHAGTSQPSFGIAPPCREYWFGGPVGGDVFDPRRHVEVPDRSG